nr:hypothetical protein [Tanacetum cinerariifolium]
MVAYLTKSDASEGFNQVIDFLNGSYIKYALIVNPNIYVPCIKQFWNTVAIKQVNDVTRLQALIYKNKLVVIEAAIREVLRLDDAEGVDCLPNKKIFTKLARMRYDKPSTKLIFYKAYFSSQCKFLIHTILQSMSAKRTSWNEFSSSMASAVICLSKGRKFNFFKYIFDSLVRNVDSTSKFYMYYCFLQLLIRKQVGYLSTHTTKYTFPALTQKVFANMRRVGKGFSRVETPLFEGMLVGQDINEEGDADEHVEDVTLVMMLKEMILLLTKKFLLSLKNHPYHLLPHLLHNHNHLKISHQHPRRVEHLEYDKVAQALEITKLKRRVKKLENRNKDKKDEEDKISKVVESDQVQGRQAESQAKIYRIDMDRASKVLSMQEDKPAEMQEVVDVVTTGKLITEVVTVVSETVTAASAIIPTVEPQVLAAIITVALAKVAATPSRRRKGVLDYFKGMSYDDIRPIFKAMFNSNVDFLLKTKEQMEEEESRALQTINKTPVEKAGKRRKLNEEVKDLKRHFEIVPDEDDDVYTEATLLARKNFDREDLEALWKLVKERFTCSSLKNQRTIHGQAKVKSWKLLESYGVHIITFTTTQLVLLVERRYPLLRFTLDQMLNAVRLRVEEESEVSLKLLRFIRQQHQKGQFE